MAFKDKGPSKTTIYRGRVTLADEESICHALTAVRKENGVDVVTVGHLPLTVDLLFWATCKRRWPETYRAIDPFNGRPFRVAS
ncbi:hypothetical protein EVAR_4956_1 [Eumeta japonica]|uniref:Uncharacterized protein n=1 Tax=Eumeta variegata TaxID=151549 RepID=A0A4C1UZP4_EUMVA|nr:hypothetical protein EVAR_4956_1 [Eumeta japonica]